jgi:hypothetical protein
MTGEVHPPTGPDDKGTHTSYCYLKKKRKGPEAFDPKCWCAQGRAAPAGLRDLGVLGDIHSHVLLQCLC